VREGDEARTRLLGPVEDVRHGLTGAPPTPRRPAGLRACRNVRTHRPHEVPTLSLPGP
jgi:hypothetical protein